MLLSANHVTQKINEKILFDDIQFSIDSNEKIALIGVNGTGKSTLLKAIALQDPLIGEFSARSGIRIHYLPQNPVFTEDTIWEEIISVNQKIRFRSKNTN